MMADLHINNAGYIYTKDSARQVIIVFRSRRSAVLVTCLVNFIQRPHLGLIKQIYTLVIAGTKVRDFDVRDLCLSGYLSGATLCVG